MLVNWLAAIKECFVLEYNFLDCWIPAMTLKQLRYLCEIVRHELHLSRAAETLHTSQPGVSKQIQLLERELGLTISASVTA